MSTRYPTKFTQTDLEYWEHRRDCLMALKIELRYNNADEIKICDDEILKIKLQKLGVSIIDVEGEL